MSSRTMVVLVLLKPNVANKAHVSSSSCSVRDPPVFPVPGNYCLTLILSSVQRTTSGITVILFVIDSFNNRQASNGDFEWTISKGI